MLLLPTDMLGEIVKKGKLEPSVNHCYLCRFVRMDMMDLPPRRELASATCIYATLGYKPPDLGEVMAGNSNRFWLYTSPVQSCDEAILTLTRAARHTQNKELRFTALTTQRFFVVFSGTLVEFARSRRELYV